eukprot:scaffold271618_cov30-Tisochrysis_lutea.AAC.1
MTEATIENAGALGPPLTTPHDWVRLAHRAALVAGFVQSSENCYVPAVSKRGFVEAKVEKLVVRLVGIRDGTEGCKRIPLVFATCSAA